MSTPLGSVGNVSYSVDDLDEIGLAATESRRSR